jgi:outer membrane immunogenic protein
MMKKAIIAGLIFGTTVAPAIAADLYARSAPPLMPVCEWCGVYLGANAGVGVGVDSFNTSVSASGPDFPGNAFLSSSDTHALTGGLFGGQIGYNWQSANWVWGGEFDWDWSGQTNTSSKAAQNLGGGGGSASLTDSEKINSIGTLRARLGWANAGWLWYVTGGVAWAEVNDTFTGSTSNPLVALNGTPVSFSKTKSGGTVGAGVETRLWGGWSAKLEYLYVNLGSTDHAFTTTNVFGDSATLASNHSLSDHMVRLGLNYRFW